MEALQYSHWLSYDLLIQISQWGKFTMIILEELVQIPRERNFPSGQEILLRGIHLLRILSFRNPALQRKLMDSLVLRKISMRRKLLQLLSGIFWQFSWLLWLEEFQFLLQKSSKNNHWNRKRNLYWLCICQENEKFDEILRRHFPKAKRITSKSWEMSYSGQ